MKKKILFPDTNAYIFDELKGYITIVYTIKRHKRLYILDTFMGSHYMDLILKDIDKNLEIIVVNTHFHYDHFFGNSAFKESPIYAHQQCYELIIETKEEVMKEYFPQMKGIKELVLPNHLFKDTIAFISDDITLLHTPGHSQDSISIYDQKNKAIYTGDNLEKPILQICLVNRKTYANTLYSYLDYPDYRYFASHTLELEKEDIKDMIHYLNHMEEYSFEDERLQRIHEYNIELSTEENIR